MSIESSMVPSMESIIDKIVIPEDNLSILRNLYPGVPDETLEVVQDLSDRVGVSSFIGLFKVITEINNATKEVVNKVVPSKHLYLVLAHQSGQLAGIEEVCFGDIKLRDATGQTYSVPEFASITIYRQRRSGGSAESYTANIYFDEYASEIWHYQKPRLFLEGIALSAALRKAFTDLFGAVPTYEELQAKMMFNKTQIYNANRCVERIAKYSSKLANHEPQLSGLIKNIEDDLSIEKIDSLSTQGLQSEPKKLTAQNCIDNGLDNDSAILEALEEVLKPSQDLPVVTTTAVPECLSNYAQLAQAIESVAENKELIAAKPAENKMPAKVDINELIGDVFG